jgi:hypothetical protein
MSPLPPFDIQRQQSGSNLSFRAVSEWKQVGQSSLTAIAALAAGLCHRPAVELCATIIGTAASDLSLGCGQGLLRCHNNVAPQRAGQMPMIRNTDRDHEALSRNGALKQGFRKLRQHIRHGINSNDEM